MWSIWYGERALDMVQRIIKRSERHVALAEGRRYSTVPAPSRLGIIESRLKTLHRIPDNGEAAHIA